MFMFTQSHISMWYWYVEYKRLEKIDSLQKDIIDEYHHQTGISARSREDLIKSFEIKSDVGKQCQFELSEALNKARQQENRKKFWKVTSGVGLPVALISGFLFGVYIAK